MSGYRRMGRERRRPIKVVRALDLQLVAQREEYRAQRRQRRAFRKIRGAK